MQYVLDQLVPPIVRDSRWFMYLPMRFVLKNRVGDFMTFKEWVFTSSDRQFGALYERTADVSQLQGETDLNTECLNEILRLVQNKNVLDVGCGRGLLAERLSASNKVTACDVVIDDDVRARFPAVTFERANIECLPYGDDSFDVVVSTHTLEHVKNLSAAVSELRRVAKEAVVIVVPKQRPYKYTFSLHTQFFPYEWSLEAAFGRGAGVSIKNLGGDWLYHQDLLARQTA
ncbi:class I SAM-dependent methyltransferase [Actinophytocola sp.]|uniref:class I SAM-dependent methyltransferase n=1 Tax=Actinophytocola sp. TaxID=1872138 RepID=UPI002D7E28B7|nr:class I SAM-dependent methyltransferase [Actinophytocola sp.]HET9138836.1 class I SAM-dependent methyltransferase [Actinophytocola sp.]